MTDDGGYDLLPVEKKPSTGSGEPDAAGLKPGDPGWTPPVPVIEKADPVEEEVPAPPPPPDPDVEQHKGIALLSYIFFPVPLIAAPNSPFARFHANQGLLAFIAIVLIVFLIVMLEVGRWVVGNFLPIAILRVFFGCGFYLLEVALLVGWVALVIKGIVTAANGEKKELPIIGHWKLIK